MVAWSKGQESGLQTETFILLLHQLGFHLATDVGKCFPRIPHFWSPDHLYNLALKVAPLRKEELRMDLSHLEFADDKTDTNTEDVGIPIILSPSVSVKANCSWSAQSSAQSEHEAGPSSGEPSSPFTAFAM